MPSSTPTREEYYRRVRDAADNYQETVATLLAFAAFVCHDGSAERDGSGFGFGRRMTPTDAADGAVTDITPDCVAQMSASYGIVAEVKKSLPNDVSKWARTSAQLRKYDAILKGWWTDTELMDAADAVMLIHQSRGRAYAQHLAALREQDASLVGPNTAVVEFNRADESRPYIFFRREWGAIRQSELASRLDTGISVPRERVEASYPAIKFYDTEPPLEDLLKTLWMDVFHASFDPRQTDTETGVQLMQVTVAQLADELQQAFGSKRLRRDARSAEFPRAAWIRRALDRLVEFGLAKLDGAGDQYTIKYKAFSKGDVLERFCRLSNQKREKQLVAEGQLTLALEGRDADGAAPVPREEDA